MGVRAGHREPSTPVLLEDRQPEAEDARGEAMCTTNSATPPCHLAEEDPCLTELSWNWNADLQARHSHCPQLSAAIMSHVELSLLTFSHGEVCKPLSLPRVHQQFIDSEETSLGGMAA